MFGLFKQKEKEPGIYGQVDHLADTLIRLKHVKPDLVTQLKIKYAGSKNFSEHDFMNQTNAKAAIYRELNVAEIFMLYKVSKDFDRFLALIESDLKP